MPSRQRLARALRASRDAFHVADDADEGAAVLAGISLRCALLVAARTATHGVVFLELSHGVIGVIRPAFECHRKRWQGLPLGHVEGDHGTTIRMRHGVDGKALAVSRALPDRLRARAVGDGRLEGVISIRSVLPEDRLIE